MVAAIGTALTNVVSWIGTGISAIVGSEGALNPLLPLLAIAVGISLIMLTVKVIRKVSWGA